MTVRSRLGRRWRSVSFRSGLLAALSVGIVALLAFFMLTVLVFVLFSVTGAVAETSLVDRAEDQLLLGVEPADLNLDTTFEGGGRPRGEGDDAFWVVLVGDDVVRSEGVVEQEVLDAAFTENDVTVEIETSQRPDDLVGIKAVEGREWFYLERSVAVPDGPTYRVVTAYDGTFSLWSFARSSFPVTIPLLLILMGVAMAVTSWLTRRALRRVEDMRAEVELITQQSLDRRVPIVDASDGIEKLAHTMNDMLGRLESSAAQQNQFLADASHELRSPVAGLLAQLDVATAYPDRVDPETLLPKLQGEAQRLQVLVDDLLFLSRSEAMPASAATEAGSGLVDVDGLIEAQVGHQRDKAVPVALVVGEPVGAEVRGNPSDLARAVRNLLDNAVRHASGEVRVGARVVDGTVVIQVADDGSGIAAEDEERVFKRFVRLDDARTRDVGGAGLGLALASEIASKHQGRLGLVPSVLGGATFELTLPLAAGQPVA